MSGAPANFAYHVAQAGLKSCIVSAIGKDKAGDEILQILEDKKLAHQIARTTYPTGSVDVETAAYVCSCDGAMPVVPAGLNLKNLL